MEDFVVRYFEHLMRSCEQANRYRLSGDVHILTDIHRQLHHHCNILDNLRRAINTHNGYLLDRIYDIVFATFSHVEDILRRLNNSDNVTVGIIPTLALNCGTLGRPGYNITPQQINFFRGGGMKWNQIALTLGVSRRTLYRRLSVFNIDRQEMINDEQLDNVLREIINEMPNSGEIYIMGNLRAKNIFIPRRKLRERLNILCPVARSLRRRNAVRRRLYSVRGPNYLW